MSRVALKCYGCGAPIALNLTVCEYCGAIVKDSDQTLSDSVKLDANEEFIKNDTSPESFFEKLKLNFLLGWSHYFDFGGKATREQYWFYILAIVLIYLFGLLLEAMFQDTLLLNDMIAVLLVATYLALIIPTVAIGVRRLHDINKSGWWYLISLIPLVGSLVLLYWFVQPSKSSSHS